MKHYLFSYHSIRLFILVFLLLAQTPAVFASVAISGDSTLADPDTAAYPSDMCFVGKDSIGGLRVDSGSILHSQYAGIGQYVYSNGNALVTQSGSTWNVDVGLSIGSSGVGSLTINSGGNVYGQLCQVGGLAGIGALTVDGGSSMMTGTSVSLGDTGGYGTLNITGGGKVVGTSGAIGANMCSRGLATVSGPGSSWTMSSVLTVGGGYDYAYGSALGEASGSGALKIANGGSVTCGECVIDGYAGVASTGPLWTGYIGPWGQATSVNRGYYRSSAALVTISGNGSIFQPGLLTVGYAGDGVLMVTNGGAVNCSEESGVNMIGDRGGSNGTVIVSGANSVWNSSGYTSLCIGLSGNGKLMIADGGAATAASVSIGSNSLLAIDVGNGSSLTVGGGTGTITNRGTVRISAGRNTVAGVYTPISATWGSGSGTFQAVGGSWNTSTHQFAVAEAQTGSSGIASTIDLANTQRIVVTDSETGLSVGASFAATDTNLTFKATAITDATLSSLKGELTGTGQSVLSGWLFTTDKGYSDGNSAYLSLSVGSGYSLDGLTIWHYDDETEEWSKYTTATDLTYDGTYANFTVAGFSGYAVSGMAVPEPSALVLLAIGAISLMGYVWRGRMRTA